MICTLCYCGMNIDKETIWFIWQEDKNMEKGDKLLNDAETYYLHGYCARAAIAIETYVFLWLEAKGYWLHQWKGIGCDKAARTWFYCKARSTSVYPEWWKADTNQRVHDVQWTSALHRPKRSVDHPVFIAQHATATCCRECIIKWHGKYSGWTAQIIQREIDHCNGIVI